uniref:DUF4298 domain-containing protein n=1 Tax=Ruminococcus sp. TaxID=41978 RepID=UPI003864367C
MSYITTVTGIHFYPLNPNPKDIDIEDIAHALSLICRANGHFRHFYSVAQHCIACAEEAIERGYSPEVILGCLLHDASEAYLCDVTRPVKKHIPQYLQAEEKLQEVIWKRFIGRELTDTEKNQIFEIDDDILSMEFHLLMPEDLNEDYRKLQGSYTCEYQDPQEVKSRFIQMATLDITVERLLEDDYWIIDILPSQIPIEKQAEYRALTDEYFESGKVAQLHRRYADILTMINSRFKTAMLCMPEDEWTISPDDVAVKDAVIHHTERGCVDLLLPEEETLISLQAEDLYITVFHPTEEILSLLRQAVSESGFYIWQTPQIARIKKYESYLNEAQQLLCAGENSDRLKYLISELEAYYESVKWRKDFENDEAGLLPKNLKRGVLSEDGINDLLDEYKEVSE